jgi:hypothetical protein
MNILHQKQWLNMMFNVVFLPPTMPCGIAVALLSSFFRHSTNDIHGSSINI